MSNEIVRFEDLKLSPEILKAVGKMGFSSSYAGQAQTIR